MRHPRLAMVASAVTFFVAACNPPAPTRHEAALEEPAPTPDPVTTEVPGVAESSPLESSAAVEQALRLRFVSPNIGPPAGGNEVAIDGQGISRYPRVFFGDAQAWIVSVTPSEIRVMVPPQVEPVVAGGTLTVDVVVRNPPVGSEEPASETLVQAYSYIDTSAPPPVAEKPPEPPPKSPEPVVVPARGAAGESAGESDSEGALPEASPKPAAAPTSNLVASFSFETTESEECSPPNTSIRFTDRSTGGVTEWRWDFGDGSTSEQRHQEHCYTIPGMRSVTLTVSNAQGSASTSKIVIAGME